VADTEPSPARRAAGRPYVLGGPLQRPSRAGWLSALVLAVVVAIPLRGLYLGTGSSMEEGFMLVFPKQMLRGDVPNVDFLHLYGPGSLHTLMGWYRVFGYTLESQRTFGLLQHLGIIAGVLALTKPWGHRIAVIASITVTFLVLTPIGLSALAWEGAVALGLDRWHHHVPGRAGHDLAGVDDQRGAHPVARRHPAAPSRAGVRAGLGGFSRCRSDRLRADAGG
jgi:hypothetical protein